MTKYTHISCQELQQNRAQWLLVDIRDEQAFAQAHVPGAMRLDNDNVAGFLANTPPTQPIAVMCYHGISSQPAAAYLVEHGLTEVASVDGGFEHWRQHYPHDSAL